MDDSVLRSPAATLRGLGLGEIGLAVVVLILDLLAGGPSVWSWIALVLFLAGHVMVGSGYVVAATASRARSSARE